MLNGKLKVFRNRNKIDQTESNERGMNCLSIGDPKHRDEKDVDQG